MEIARSLRDERGGGDIITTDSGDEDQMHLSEKKVNYLIRDNTSLFNILSFIVSTIKYKHYYIFMVISLATMGRMSLNEKQ